MPSTSAGGGIDIPSEVADILVQTVSLWRETEKAIRSRRMREMAHLRKAAGLAYCNPPLGKRVVRREGVAYLEWDKTELRHIAEIARRVRVEGVEAVAKDFWRREIKDR